MGTFLILGYGSIGKRHAVILREMGYETITVDPNPAMEAQWTTTKCVTEWQFDGVLDCTPPDVRAVCSQNWDVPLFIEKPLGILPERNPASFIQMGFCYRWCNTLEDFLQSLEDKRVYSVTMVAGQWLPHWHRHLGIDYRDRYHGTPGRGGVCNDSLSHSLYIARWIFGELELVGSVAGKFSGLDIATEDTAAVLLKAKTGQPCTILVDYLRKPGGSYIEAVTSGGVRRWEFVPAEADTMYRRQMEVFTEICVGERQYGFPTLADGVAVQRILDEVKDGT